MVVIVVLMVRQKVWNKNHEVVAQSSKAINVVAPATMVSQQMRVQKPKLWSLSSPYLYMLQQKFLRMTVS